MSKLSRKPNSYIWFELARLRTLWYNNEGFRDRIEKRYNNVKGEFYRRNFNWILEEHPIDKIIKEKYTKSTEKEICKVESVESSKHTVGPLKGQTIENIYEYTLSKEDKIVGRTTGTNLLAKEGDELTVLRVTPRVYEVINKKQHSRIKCMSCNKAPEVEVLWAEGMGHAWFCKEHFEEWKKKPTDMSNTGTYEGDIVSVRDIDGEASEKWSEPIKKIEKETE